MPEFEPILIRQTKIEDYEQIRELSLEAYPSSPPWSIEQIRSHLNLFPQGQLVAVDSNTNEVVGMAASLIVKWDDYDFESSWRDFTDKGLFTNHDPSNGKTLYGAEIMVKRSTRSKGVGSLIYKVREQIAINEGLIRIRAGARLRGYGRYAAEMSVEKYVELVTKGELRDPTLSFQINRGFNVLKIITGYLAHDPESLGHAAVIEWKCPIK